MASMALWQKLLALVEIDTKQDAYFAQIQELKNTIQETKNLIPELESSLKQLKQRVTDAKKAVDDNELNAQDIKTKLEEKRRVQDSVKNQKEYLALEKEISSLSAETEQLDDALVAAWEDLETAKTEQEAKTPEITTQIDAQKEAITKKEAEIATLQEQHDELAAKREHAKKQLPEQWQEKYERLRGKIENPIVPALHNSCSACYYLVPPQDMTRLKREAILPCRSCYRYLYFDQTAEKDSNNESF